MQHEHSGLPDTSYQQETPLLGAQSQQQKSWEALTKSHPDASAIELESMYSPTKRLQVKMKGVGKKIYYLFTKEKGTGKERLNPELSNEIIKALGPPAEEIIAEDRDTTKEMKQRKAEKEKEYKEAKMASSQIDEKSEDIEVLRRKIDSIQSRIDAIHDKYGSNLEMEAELRKLKLQKKNYETDLLDKKKELASLQKQAKNIDKIQSDIVRLGATISEKERKTNAMQERLNQTKTLDELKDQESEMKSQNAEDQAIMQDENASPSDKEAAEGRVAERNEELARLQPQIAERERERPLLERVKEIFKKYGVTIASVLLAAGVTIGVVVSTVTNALKASTKALGKGLKDIGAKLGSLLPGLIGSIANFLFKAAGQAIGFLAEHTWLLILAVVAFLFEKNIKKRR